MAEEATMNTTTEAPVQKGEYTLKMEKYWERIAERNKKAADTCSAILLGCDMTKITKTQIREIHQYVRRNLEWAEADRERAYNGEDRFEISAKHLKQVELASRALRQWTEWKAQVVAVRQWTEPKAQVVR